MAFFTLAGLFTFRKENSLVAAAVWILMSPILMKVLMMPFTWKLISSILS